MALQRRKILSEMMDLGYGTATVPADSGGSLTGNLVGIHSFLGLGYLSPGDFSGADFVTQLAAAYTALPSTGGYLDARGMSDTLTISSDMTLGSLTKPMVLLLRHGQQITLSNATLSLSSGSWIIGARQSSRRPCHVAAAAAIRVLWIDESDS